MLRLAYSFLLTLMLPLLFMRLWRRSADNPDYRRRWRERLGRPAVSPVRSQPLIWVHAVSVGESMAARSLINQWRETMPDVQFLVTTTTPTGSELVRSWEPHVLHQYMPFDLTSMYRSLFLHYRPGLIVLMETEVWPNLIALANRTETPIALVNARMSMRSAWGYERFRWLSRPAFAGLSRVLAQTETDADRLRKLGARPERVAVTGSIKYDIRLTAEEETALSGLKERLGDRPVIVAGSLHPGEEDVVINAYRSLLMVYPRLVLVVAPRHQERFEPMGKKLEGLNLKYARRSLDEVPASGDSVWLLDTLGELKVFYGLARVALLGGSWVDRGSHNPLEPAMQGVPVITGPSVYNFSEASQLLSDAGALRQTSARDLYKVLLDWLGDDDARARDGAAGKAVVAANQGATARQVDSLRELLR
ncbi:3-deoxy-D-manno-octulosonic acid transferase [Natronospirillum operosum]|uniref:3-deoxy-D-manno-octulosonic acid transferase n=1 Tax=Natronospirillum operosum TaxID=2759953 RepID=A0A4Z0W6U6_9GAMM|nr:3-deoxy-D-manno-octulosonic acid transferase [Natronospirillum operosum]TGG92925.1 3-deoxy-D-manno-octulosonic acid transferase [Natronospirillum operosum]